jgi:hypothetical protein
VPSWTGALRLGRMAATLAILGATVAWASGRGTTAPAAPGFQIVVAGRMSAERAAHQATLLKNGCVLVTGGCSGPHCETILATAELYDPIGGTFRTMAPMSTPRASHAAVLLSNGRVLVLGGWTGARATATSEIYDPVKNRWVPAGDMTEARASPIAVVLRDGRVLVVGGGRGGVPDLASAEIFDPDSTRFSATGAMKTNHYLATRLADGRVLVTGGQGPLSEILRSAEVFDPSSGEFHPTGAMTTARVKHAAALLNDGRVLIIGGSDARGYRARFATTEIYDPAKGRFGSGPAMQWGRHKLRDAVVVLPSGDVLVAGGARHPELFDPGLNEFVPVRGELSGPQMFATATLLPSGDVLVLGGYDHNTQPSSSAWLITRRVP